MTMKKEKVMINVRDPNITNEKRLALLKIAGDFPIANFPMATRGRIKVPT